MDKCKLDDCALHNAPIITDSVDFFPVLYLHAYIFIAWANLNTINKGFNRAANPGMLGVVACWGAAKSNQRYQAFFALIYGRQI